MPLTMTEPYYGVQFVLQGDQVLGCYFEQEPYSLQDIFSLPALHEIYHRFIKGRHEELA